MTFPDDVFEMLKTVRARYGPTMTNDQCVEALNAVAWRFPGWGLLRKPDGNHGTRKDGVPCSVDFLLAGANGFDVFRDAGGATEPQQPSESEPMDIARFVVPIAPEDVPPPPPPPPPPPVVDLAQVLAAIAALSAKVDAHKVEHDAQHMTLVMGVAQILDRQRQAYTGTIRYLGPLRLEPEQDA